MKDRDACGDALRVNGPKRRGRKGIAAALAAGALALGLAGYAAAPSSFAAGLPMGFGIQRASDPGQFNHDWLGLDRGAKWLTVDSYLQPLHATWVNAHVGWGDLVGNNASDTYAQIERWARLATLSPNMHFLLSIDYRAPGSLATSNDCNLPASGSKVAGNAAINSMRNGLHGLYSYVDSNQTYGAMSQYWPNIQLEIGTEPNQNGACDIERRDAQLWWDVTNDVAKSAHDDGWYPGLGIVSGGVFTNTATPGPNESPKWGSGSIDATSWLEEGIHNDRVLDPDSWEHYGPTSFDAYGVHTAHCGDQDYRTRWDCTRGVDDRVRDVRQALVDTNQPVDNAIEITALIVTQTNRPDRLTPPGDNWTQADQERDTTRIWNQLHDTYGSYDNWPLTLVIWNHLVDTGQGLFIDQSGQIQQTNDKDFGYAGWMRCGADDPFCGPDTSYNGKTLYDSARHWSGVQYP
jgi:hypothetical protein